MTPPRPARSAGSAAAAGPRAGAGRRARRAFAAARRRPDVVEHIGVVEALADTGTTVNVRVRGGLLPFVPCVAAYAPRAVGDKVTIRESRAGLLVLGKIGQVPVAAPAELPDAPADGSAATVPSRRLVAVSDRGSWRDGNRRGDLLYPVQGAPAGQALNTGGLFYGPALHAAVTTGAGTLTVAAVELTLARSPRRHGIDGSVPVHLYVHTAETPPGPPPGLAYGPYPVGTLQLGQRATFPLPAGALAALAGDGRGFALWSPTTDDYLILTGTAGAVRVTYR